MNQAGKTIDSARTVIKEVKEMSNLEVNLKLVRSVLKQDLKLSFLKSKKLHPLVTSQRCLVLRQQYALKMLDLLKQGKRIVNIDETWLNESSYIRRTWSKRGGAGNAVLNSITPRLSMISALDTEGRVWFSLSHSTTDSNVIATFLQHLAVALSQETPGWEEDTVFLWDNARYHCS